MTRILPDIDLLKQHQQRVQSDPDAFRPACCPHCGMAGLHLHGHYERNVPKGEGLSLLLGVLLILRFLCPGCRRSCSCLPACLSPRRHYWWRSQQGVLGLLVAGQSIHQVAKVTMPYYRTILRWWKRLEACFDTHALSLRSRFPDLGRSVGLKGFWSRCFSIMSLEQAMGWLDHEGITVP
jgi:hypothetical protein